MNAHSTIDLSRRKALFGLGALAVVAPVAAVAAGPHPDAALLAAWDGYRAALRDYHAGIAIKGGTATDEEADRLWMPVVPHETVIREHRASTVEGFAVQMRYLFAVLMESKGADTSAIFGAAPDAVMLQELREDYRHAMLWSMAQAATEAGGLRVGRMM